MPVAFAIVLIGSLLPTAGCVDLRPPAPSSVLVPFERIGRWEGHFGVDVASPTGAVVYPIGRGVVSFVGVVVGNRSVTVDHGGGVRTSYSYLADALVSVGDLVSRSSVVGVSGFHSGRAAFHLSVRLNGEYVDPLSTEECSIIPMGALYLAATPSYPRSRVRHSRWDVRSPTHRPSGAGGDRARATRPRSGQVRSRA